MRILIAGSTYPPQINGQSIFTGNLAQCMTGLGHDVLVMTPSTTGKLARTLENGILRWSVRSLDLSFIHRDLFIAFGYEGMVNEALDTFQPNIIHLQDSAPLNRCLLRAARRRNIPVMITHHIGPAVGAPYFTWFTDLLNGRMEGFVWTWIISFLNQADVLTAPSKAAADMLRRHRVIPPVWPISCGVHLEHFRPERNIKPIPSGSQKKAAVFLYVGRLDWEKRPDVILRAIALLPPDAAQLIMAGTGGAEKELKALAKDLNINDRVCFLGDIVHDQVPELYSACDIFVMPGDAESLSIATLEAMAAGKPVLAANSMALPELVEMGVNGLLFQPRSHQNAAEHMQWFIDHPQDWKRMGQASMLRAVQHSIPAVMGKFETLYQTTLAHVGDCRRARPAAPSRPRNVWMPQRILPHLKALFLVVFLFLFSGMVYSETVAAPPVRLENMPTLSLDGIRHVLIVSPHPDDPVLVAGGLIQNAVERGISVQTVIVTNGEEWPVLPALLELSSETFENLEINNYHAETLAAMKGLGVPEQQVIFLGYTSGQWYLDRDIVLDDEMENALALYPQHASLQTALISDFHQLFAAYSPDIILLPHPADVHPDHKAVSQAARIAAARQFSRSSELQPQVLGYLVDYETYPDPVDMIDLSPLLPPAGLSNPKHAWINIPLDQEQVQVKRQAIHVFPLETNRIGWVLTSFARPNEVFTPLTIQNLPVIQYPKQVDDQSETMLTQLPSIPLKVLQKQP